MTFTLPSDLISGFAQFWRSYNPDFVLREEVAQWLQESGIPYTICEPELPNSQGPQADGNLWTYQIAFHTDRDAIFFKLHWM